MRACLRLSLPCPDALMVLHRLPNGIALARWKGFVPCTRGRGARVVVQIRQAMVWQWSSSAGPLCGTVLRSETAMPEGPCKGDLIMQTNMQAGCSSTYTTTLAQTPRPAAGLRVKTHVKA